MVGELETGTFYVVFTIGTFRHRFSFHITYCCEYNNICWGDYGLLGSSYSAAWLELEIIMFSIYYSPSSLQLIIFATPTKSTTMFSS